MSTIAPILSVELDGAYITAYVDRHIGITLADRRHFETRPRKLTKHEARLSCLTERLTAILAQALEDVALNGRPYGYRYIGFAEPKMLTPKDTAKRDPRRRESNRRSVNTAALSTVLAHQIEAAGCDDEGDYLDVRLGLNRTIRIHLAGLTGVTLEELDK